MILMTTAPQFQDHSRSYTAIRERPLDNRELSWHGPRDTQLKEDAHLYRETNGVQILSTLRSLTMNALQLDGFWSITEGLTALAHAIPGLLALLDWREQPQALSSA